MRFPEKLNKGDMVGIVCPASPVAPERMDECIRVLQEQGYRVREGKSCRRKYHGYLSGTDEVRAADLNEMFENPQVKGIFCARGGNGSGRIMNLLNYDMIRKNPKVFVGYSDITNLHAAFNTLCDFVTYHGPMVSSNMVEHYDDYTKESFETLLAMGAIWEFHNPPGERIRTLNKGRAEGILTGGNLSLISDMLGTFYAPDFRKKILFLEDVHESVANIDRMIGQLQYQGILEQISGLILGDFSESANPYDPDFGVEQYIEDQFRDLRIPVVYHVAVGHCYPAGSLPLGAHCILDADYGRILFERR